MTAEGRARRGKENYEAGKFLNNSETLAYIASMDETEVVEEDDGETLEEVKAISDMTVDELKAELDAQDISYESNALKADLVALLEA